MVIEKRWWSREGGNLRQNTIFHTDWRLFFDKLGVSFTNPGFPSTTPPKVQHPDGCTELKMAVTEFEMVGQMAPPDLVLAMKKACN